jgi:hypothetical protein
MILPSDPLVIPEPGFIDPGSETRGLPTVERALSLRQPS